MLTEPTEQVEEDLLPATHGVIHLPSGGTIQVLPPPPPGFDPLQADERELQLYGIPSRPSDPEPLGLWRATLGCRRIEPVFRRLASEAPAAPAREYGSYVESGAVVERPSPLDGINFIWALWTVPNVYPPYGATDGIWYSASQWIGLLESSYQLKVGAQCRVVTTFGSVARQFIPFWELPREGVFQVLSLAISPGDVMACAINVEASAAAANVYLNNLTANTGVAFKVSTFGGGPIPAFLGYWMVEALRINNPPPFPALARYGRVYFDVAYGQTVQGKYLFPGAGQIANMFDSKGQMISYAETPLPILVRVIHGKPHF